MTRWIPLMMLGAMIPFPALAAPPSAFQATGTARAYGSDAPPQPVPISLYYQGGQIRLEMRIPDQGTQIILAKKGHPKVTLLDPQARVAFRINSEAMSAQEGVPSIEQLVDLASWKQQLAKGGKPLGRTETVAGQRCTLWEKRDGKNLHTVWFSDSLELPMRIETTSGGKARFGFTVTRFAEKDSPASLFAVPKGYQEADLDPNAKL